MTEARKQTNEAWGVELQRITNETITRILVHLENRRGEATSVASTAASLKRAREEERLRHERQLELEVKLKGIEHKKRLLELEKEASKVHENLMKLQVQNDVDNDYLDPDFIDVFENLDERIIRLKASTPAPQFAPVLQPKPVPPPANPVTFKSESGWAEYEGH